MHLLVVGLGYVGLPLVMEAARSGVEVTGLDVSTRVVEGLNAGRSHVDDIAEDELREALDRGFRATDDASVTAKATAVVICVPTPLSTDGGPDLAAVIGAGKSVAPHLQPGTVVVLESTTYPGTTEEILRPLLEEGSGLVAGRDFHLGYSPERIDPGNATYGLRNTPKIVGGLTAECTEAVREVYAQVVDEVVVASGIREAEAAKLLENTYRHVNIALVNEMARFFHELDVDFWDVIRLAGTKPFGFQAFYPGPGVGGHCIPIDPNYLSHRVRSQLGYAFRFVELAQEINATMPGYVAQRAQALLNEHGLPVKGSKVLLLGITYKPDISDQRESPAVRVAEHLRRLGAEISYHDPYVTDWHVEGVTAAEGSAAEAAADADLAILLQNHKAYDVDAIVAASKVFLDTRGTSSEPRAHKL